MAAFRSASFCLIVCFLICSSEALEIKKADLEIKKADLGQNVILPCKAPNNNIILAVEWIRPDQEPEYVLLYRDEHLDPEYQHPSYQNRVDLQDKEMKDGDVSLTLKNVTMEDRGRYVCRVFQKGTNRKKRSILKTEPISIINLEVRLSGEKVGNTGDGGDTDEGEKDGGNMVGIIVGSVVGVILLLPVLASVLIYRRSMRQNRHVSVLLVE